GKTPDLATTLRTWSNEIVVCTDGPPDWKSPAREKLEFHGVRVIETPVVAVEGREQLERVRFADGSAHECTALFFCGECRQKSPLPARLGCKLDKEGSVVCDRHAAAGVPGVYVAGNVRAGLHLAIHATSEGAEAAVAINDALLEAGLFPAGIECSLKHPGVLAAK
ncbi:MAG: FAD-dependent pyridine nucleotide-disulfide oxidoreductase, partial [Verrucomicrobia bacterium]|nr:FAD-dependent pyridine nucleotide-disulfide oxidoreductase [Verrucomicrobiota bacterium]